jgi:putative transposase
MSALCDVLKTSRQALKKRGDTLERRHEREECVLRLIRDQREVHPRIGLRKLYERHHATLPVGRDVFIAIGRCNGYALERPVNKRRTTYAGSERHFPNLLIGRKLNDTNQVWVSDITYYPVGSRFSYITLVMDLYSRRIVGYHVARTMQACWTIKAFEQALIDRAIAHDHRLIAHSDQGGQYISTATQLLMASKGVLISTSEIVYENSHAERLNGIIKQEYLDAWPITSHAVLEHCVEIAVERYNSTRPHGGLSMRSPIEFETELLTLALDEHPLLEIWPPQALTKLSLGVTIPYKL